MQLSISPDEQQVACALSCGMVMVFELQQANTQLLTSSLEHRGREVTTLIWAFCQPELYIGDASGRVTMLYASKSKTASLFRSSSLHLMTLESSIIQLDYQEGYLLVSTLTHSYVCNTNSETFSQVGTKLRQGEYGSCFCQVNHSGMSSSHTETSEGVEELKASLTSSTEKFGLSDCYEAKEEEQAYHNCDLRKNRPSRTASPMLMSHVFCARPGTRIWEADYSGKVLVTHQLKSALIIPPAEVLLTDGSFKEKELLEEISLLPETLCPTDKTREKLTGHELAMSTPVKATHPPVSVAFTKMMSFYNKYLLAISAYGLYIIDPAISKILIWISVSEGITDVKVSGNSLIYKSGSGCIQNFMITTVDIAILVLHSRKLFLECTSLCLKYKDIFTKSELLSRLGAKILTDLCNNITSGIIKEKIKGLRLFIGINKERNHTMNLTKVSGVTYIKNKSFEAEEIKANLNVALKKNNSFSFNMTVARWNSEPYLGGSKKEWEQSSLAQGTLSKESIPMQQEGKNMPNNPTSVHLHEIPDYSTSVDTLPSGSSEKCIVDFCSTSQKFSSSSRPDLENITTPTSDSYSPQSDALSSQKSLDSSTEMIEDPLFTPNDSPSPDQEAVSRMFPERHPPTALNYASHNFYNLAYAPIHPGSEAATLLQDLMENVTTNVVDTFASGTRTLTERLKSVVPLVSPQKGAEGVVSGFERTGNHPSNGPNDYPILTPLKNTDVSDDPPADIVIHTKSRKKQPQKQLSVVSASGSSEVDLEETASRPELPGVVKNLHELVCTTMQQMISTTNSEEAHNLLAHWFEVFCHTVQEMQHDSTYSSQTVSEDQTGEGPVSLSSIESSHSLGSADTSSDSLHWDSSDIGFEPSSLSLDILEKISGLFLESLQAGVTVNNFQLSLVTAQKADFPQHPMTPSEVRRCDALYAQVIASDCGLLQYSHILNALESLGHHYYLLTWAALMEKITKNSNTLSQPLPDIIPDLEFTRAQWVSILHSVASSSSTKNLITTAAQFESPIVIQDVIFLLQYMTTHPVQMNCTITKTQIPKLLLQYLIEFSYHRSPTKAYLDSWCHYSELQGDILCALLSMTNVGPSHFSCKCGMPVPCRRHVALEALEETVLLHDILDPKGLAEMCQSLGYWKGYCIITLAYCLQPHIQLFPYILQTCDADLLNNFLEVLHHNDFGMAFRTIARITSKETSIMLCFDCQSKIPFPEKKIIIEDNRAVFNHKVKVNGNSSLTENLNESCLMEVSSKRLTNDQMPVQDGIRSINHLWEVVVAKVLRRSSAANTLRLLTSVQDTIPPGIISKRVFNWCILASLAEQRGSAASWALLDSLCGDKTKLYSHKVFQAIHRRPLLKYHRNQTDMSSKSLCWDFPDTTQNGIPQPPTNITPKDPRHPVPLGHHWGVWTEVLEGVCSCCRLRLSTEALVSEGGITVFSCSHAFHTICLSYRGYQCVCCAQLQPSKAAY
ncbi:uncharacterized protein LOC135100446 isoform X2 [Scylla paramamosain]